MNGELRLPHAILKSCARTPKEWVEFINCKGMGENEANSNTNISTFVNPAYNQAENSDDDNSECLYDYVRTANMHNVSLLKSLCVVAKTITVFETLFWLALYMHLSCHDIPTLFCTIYTIILFMTLHVLHTAPAAKEILYYIAVKETFLVTHLHMSYH